MKKLLKNLFKSSLQKGFTLIELLVVIAVIGVLAAIVLLAVNPGEQLARARDTSRISAVTQLGRALQGYYTSQGAVYPAEGQTAPIWTTKLTTTGDLKTVPTNATYTSAPVAPVCTYASYAIGGVVTGYCYRATVGADAIVYVKLESSLYDGKCAGTEDAFWVFSTADAKAGGVCRTVAQGEPTAVAQTFTF
jgi:prepilin-type N-terminal cleavage/methylation domain-containing protein